MVLLVEFFNPAHWRDWFNASINELGYTDFWLAVGQIIFINILLSGDNAIVIAMACRDLPERQRRWGLIIGAAIAALLRIAFTIVLTELMLLPYLKLIGGAALLYIAAKLLIPEDTEKKEIEAAAQLWRAVMLILVADIVMSFDNVVAIAAAAHGDVLLLAIGLAISIPLLIGGAALLATMIDRLPFLIWAGAALLGWIAGLTMATDPAVTARLAMFGEAMTQQVEFAASVAAAVLAIAAGGLWQRLRHSHVGSRAANVGLLARVFSKFSQIWTRPN